MKQNEAREYDGSSSDDDSDNSSEISFSCSMTNNHHDSADDSKSEDKPIMENYDPKLEKTLNTLTVLIKSKKRSSVNEVYVDIPPRKKVRGSYNKEIENEIIYNEQECLDALMSADFNDLMSDNDYEKFYLDDFIFYDSVDNEVVDMFPEKSTDRTIFWDGNIVEGVKNMSCKGAIFKTFSISGFGLEESNIEVMIQSNLNDKVWYMLRTPQSMYHDIWIAFLWKAHLVKYVLDYLYNNPDVLFEDFRFGFFEWISNHRKDDNIFQNWLSEVNGNTDFRSVVANNMHLIWHEAYNLGEDYSRLPFFTDEYCPAKYSCIDGQNRIEKTVVTPKVYNWFHDLFPDLLQPIVPISESECVPFIYIQDDDEFRKINHRGKLLFENSLEEPHCFEQVTVDGMTLKVGDTVEVAPTDGSTDGRWFCMITTFIKGGRNGLFRLLWLYTRRQTILRKLDKDVSINKSRELFFSSNCECEEPWPIENIIRKIDVHFGKSSCPGYLDYSFFCRYQYSHETEDSFISFHPGLLPKEDGLICGCKRPEPNYYEEFIEKYNVNDCILLPPLKGDILDLYTICCIERFDLEKKTVWLRRFYRWSETSVKRPKSPINEILYSDYIFEFNKFQHVVCFCHVEFVKYGKKIPVNLQHRGAGNHFYFSRKYDRITRTIHPIKSESQQLSVNFPKYSFKIGNTYKLKCLDLFCGGGSLGRGFEDAGFTHCQWQAAIKTYRHNIQHDDIDILNQSVNNILSDAILGAPDARVPSKGDVEIILAGSPCQGYSYMNRQRHNLKAKRNNSLVASVISFVDYYHPRYLLLENVRKITSSEVFYRLIGCLLELGYQLHFGVVSADRMGCSQRRYRMFLWGAAQGEVLPTMPPVTHKGLKKETLEAYTSFPMISIKDHISDLPPIGEGDIWYPSFPDHRTYQMSLRTKEILRRIPTFPPARDYYYARKHKFIPDIHAVPSYDAKLIKFPKVSHLYRYCQRIDPNGLFPTICTVMRPSGYYPEAVHYKEPRMVSVREAARAQGFLDSDILCGTVGDQYKIIGNSVPRNVAFSLGLQLGRALSDTNHENAANAFQDN
ncbi:S-adenosyl-L-methionine-dependent methyltransferase [Gigaspora rosea]|uniref:DNA (cytosine-5-)-methyltransferase n=1 Tax=Gigaspora rosea TaxID=44941 RepID=A0A397VRH4_9GLOM|nr:S-adenosyl-L-methionine-dependent methyltransferase [Gigaspora rosea]